MKHKTVKIQFNVNGLPIEIKVGIPYTNTFLPDNEAIRRAGNMFREAANNAVYEIEKE